MDLAKFRLGPLTVINLVRPPTVTVYRTERLPFAYSAMGVTRAHLQRREDVDDEVDVVEEAHGVDGRRQRHTVRRAGAVPHHADVDDHVDEDDDRQHRQPDDRYSGPRRAATPCRRRTRVFCVDVIASFSLAGNGGKSVIYTWFQLSAC